MVGYLEKNSKKQENSIGDIISSFIEKIKVSNAINQENIDEIWAKAAGDTAAKHSKAVTLTNKVLIIGVDSSAWLHKLMMSRDIMVKRVNALFGGEKITKIIYKIV